MCARSTYHGAAAIYKWSSHEDRRLLPHLPRAYFDRLVEIAPDKAAIKRWLTLPVLQDLEARLPMMGVFGPGYRQILTLSMPALESVAGPDEPEFWPVFEAIGVYDLPIGLHPGRVGHGWNQLGSRIADEDFAPLLAKLGRPLDHFKKFIGDTSLSGSKDATACGLDFFGAEQVAFGSDCPFDPEGGPLVIREIIAAIDGLEIPEADRPKSLRRKHAPPREAADATLTGQLAATPSEASPRPRSVSANVNCGRMRRSPLARAVAERGMPELFRHGPHTRHALRAHLRVTEEPAAGRTGRHTREFRNVVNRDSRAAL